MSTTSSERWLNNNNQDDSSSPSSTMLTASFNQDGSCLSIGTTDGFSVFHLHPFTQSVTRPLQGSIGRVEMLFRCNVMALVGGGGGASSSTSSNIPSFAPPHRVLIWDDHAEKAIGELSFRQHVLNVKLRRDSIAVALHDRAYVYHLSDLSLRDKIYTTDNPHGLLSLSTSSSNNDMVLACPSVTDGHVRVELYGLRKTVLIEAHESSLRALALTDSGQYLATASIKGTVIRVFDVTSSACIATFRRGVERVQMTCLVWSCDAPDYTHLACCSDKGTTHVFKVLPKKKNQKDDETTTSSGWYDAVRKSIFALEDVHHSISQVRGGSIVRPLACAFIPNVPNTIAVVGWDVDGNGVLSISDYSQGEEAVRKSYHVICKATTADEEETEGQRRRKLKLGGSSKVVVAGAATEDEAKLYVGERVEVLEHQMKEIRFEEDDTGFLNILGATTTTTKTTTTVSDEKDNAE